MEFRDQPPRWVARVGLGAAQRADKALRMVDMLDVSRPTHGDRTLRQALVSLFGAAGIALLFGLAILLVGVPAAPVVRALLGAVDYLFGVAIR